MYSNGLYSFWSVFELLIIDIMTMKSEKRLDIAKLIPFNHTKIIWSSLIAPRHSNGEHFRAIGIRALCSVYSDCNES